MSIRFVEYVNSHKDNRMEFLFVDFDCFDGNDLTAKILHEKCGVIVGEKLDGFHFSVIPLIDGEYKYNLLWHEDAGNCVYVENESEESVARLRELVGIAVAEINDRIEKAKAKQA